MMLTPLSVRTKKETRLFNPEQSKGMEQLLQNSKVVYTGLLSSGKGNNVLRQGWLHTISLGFPTLPQAPVPIA